MEFTADKNQLIIFFAGRIDSNNVAALEKDIQAAVNEHSDRELIFDVDKLEYISSAGLRLLMKFRKLADKKIVIENTPKNIYEILDMTGFTKIFDVRKQLRAVSIDGCPLVGVGLSSKVYRLDADTIVKVYVENVPLYKITREIDLAKKAFLAGIPTAISYDIVRCGEKLGVVFEMIANAVTVGDALTANDGKNFDAIMRKFAVLMKLMHQTKIDAADGFPSIKGTWLDWADGMKKYYTAAEFAMLEKMINAVPDRNTIVHCDFHAGNTLWQSGEVVVVDMADVGYAHPVFDFAAGAFHALMSKRTDVQTSLSLSEGGIIRFWDTLLANYFETDNATALAELKEIFKAFAYLRGALFPMKHVQISEEVKLVYINNARKNLFPNIDWALKQAARLGDLNL